MKNIFTFLLIFCLLFHFSEITAQKGTVIRGCITQKKGGVPLPGVTIVELDNQNRVVKGLISDVNGNYVFEVSNPEHNIRVSFIGFKSQNFRINSRSRINIELEESTVDIEEVRIVAKSTANSLTGVSQRDKTGASVKVDMTKISGLPVVSAAEALQGRVSGLDIMSASGNPGSGSSIVIRGMGSIGNTNPLIVVDGIPQNIKGGDFNFASADQHDLGQLLSIAPQDIKSVEVLKDASSTAVWGSKGANGVLLIETSTGTKGKIQFNYQYKINVNIQPPSIPMLDGDEYITMQMEEWHNAKGVYSIPREIAYDRDYVDFYNYSANTNWINEITKNSFTHDHFIKMSGGGEKSRYYTSLNYQNGLGTTINTSFKRISFRVNFDYSISDNLRVTTNFSYNNSFREDNPKNIRLMSYIKAPNMSIWEYDEFGDLTGEYFTPIESYQGSGAQYFNPVAIGILGSNDNIRNEIQNNFKIDYNIFEWMKFQENVSFSYSNSKGSKFIPSSAIGVDWVNANNNVATETNSINFRWLSRSQLFITPFSQSYNHSLIGVLMFEMEQKSSESMFLKSCKTPSIFITDPASDGPIDYIASGSNEFLLYGLFASLHYKYRDRYICSFNMRSDGSSAFGENNQWGIFPSVSFAWRLSKEKFMQSLSFLDEAKIHVGWGQAGKALNEPYASYAYYETSGQYMEDVVVVPAQIELSKLKWQTVTDLNVGIDINLFRNRLSITADAYNKITKDLLWDHYPIPGTSGYEELGYYNGGELQNVGWEYSMWGTVVEQDKLDLSLSFNFSQNFNSFLSFPENFKKERGISIGNGIFPRKAEVGKPIGSFYGLRFLGVYPTDEDAVARGEDGEIIVDGNGDPVYMTYKESYVFKGGDAIYEDINHDGKIDIMDAIYIGDSSPKFIGGFGTTIKYGQLSTSFHFHFRLGFDIVNQVAIDTEGMLDRKNQSKAVLHRWKREGQDEEGILPRAYLNHPCNNLGSDRYVEKGDFMRLNSVNFTYRLDRKMTQRLNLKSMDVGISIRKLLTFTNYSGQDPEIGRVGKDPFWLGRDNARTPIPKIFSLLININF